jgi:amino acid transporter
METLTEVPANAATADASSRKPLGAWTLAAIVVGVAISQVALVGILQGVGLIGNSPPWVVIVAFVAAYALAISYALTFSELSLMLPSHGGLSTYTEVALGHFPAMLATYSGYVVVNIFGVPAELMLLDSLLREVCGPALPPLPNNAIALGVLALLAWLNVRGTDVFAALQNASALLKVALVLATGVAVWWLAPEPGAAAASAAQATTDWSVAGLGVAVGLFFWCFVGAELVCPMVTEIPRPERAIPRSMMLGITLLALLFGLYSWGAWRFLAADLLTHSPFPHLDYARAVFGRFGLPVLLVMAVAATVSLVNAIFAGVARMLYGMARNGQAFPYLGRLHPRHGSPAAAVGTLALAFAAPILLLGNTPETIVTLVVAASVSWLLAYIVAHVDLIVLRRRYPALARPFRSPWYPLPQLLGVLGMVFVIVCSPTEVVWLSGGVLVPVLLLSAGWVRWVMKKGIFTPERLPE